MEEWFKALAERMDGGFMLTIEYNGLGISCNYDSDDCWSQQGKARLKKAPENRDGYLELKSTDFKKDAVVDSSHSHIFLSEGHFPHHTTCLPFHSHLLRLRCASHQEARTDKRTDFSHVAHPPLQSLWWFWLRPCSREIPLDVLEKRNPQQLTSLLKSCSCGFLHTGFHL